LDVVAVDSWYAIGAFLKTVAEELGWPVIAVLKQERYEAHQEALALTQGQKPTQVVVRDGRQVEIGDMPSLRFTDTYLGPVRVVWGVLRWIKIIAFTLFYAFAILHGKLFRLGKTTLQELRKQIYRSLLCDSPMLCPKPKEAGT
jgi:hypothetical protein